MECFESEDWSERSLVSTLARLKRPAVEIACKNHPAPQLGHEAWPVLQVNACLAAISPGLWFEIGLTHSVLVRLEYCIDCPLENSASYIIRAVELANSWLKSCDHLPNLKIKDLNSEQPDPNKRVVISAERPILNRRDFLFAFVRSSGPPTDALTCLPPEDLGELGLDKAPPHQPAWLRQLASVYPGPQNETAEAIQQETDGEDTACECTLWPTLSVADNCAACGACARYCPSGALSTKVSGGVYRHIFTPGMCVACGLCAQVCRSGALTRSYVSENEPFEERVMAERLIGSCRKCGSPALEALDGLCYWCANEPPMRSLLENARNFLLGA